MRIMLKAAAETGLMTVGAVKLGALSRRKRALILAYHNIVPEGEALIGERSLHLPQREFAAQLDEISRYCHVVPLDDLLAQSDSSLSTRPRVAITFDDAYLGALTAGADELARRRMPATVFVAPGFIGRKAFWWDRYSVPATGELPPGFRDVALWECRGMDDAVAAYAAASGLRALDMPDHATVTTEDELREALERADIQLGCHTWNHANLASLGAGEIAEELSQPLGWLDARFDRVGQWLSYPYGMSSPAVCEAAGRAGYDLGLRIDGGWVPNVIDDRFAVPRLNVPSGLTRRGFALRISGVLSA